MFGGSYDSATSHDVPYSRTDTRSKNLFQRAAPVSGLSFYLFLSYFSKRKENFFFLRRTEITVPFSINYLHLSTQTYEVDESLSDFSRLGDAADATPRARNRDSRNLRIHVFMRSRWVSSETSREGGRKIYSLLEEGKRNHYTRGSHPGIRYCETPAPAHTCKIYSRRRRGACSTQSTMNEGVMTARVDSTIQFHDP